MGQKVIRKQLALNALESSRRFVRSQPRDPTVRFDLAKILRVTANIGRMIGQFDEPLPLYNEATALLTQLVDESPSDLAIREEAVWNTIDTGELYAMNGLPATSRSYAERATFDLVDSPASLLPESPSKHSLRAIIFLNLASAQNSSGRYEDARESGNRAVKLLSALAAAPDHDPIHSLLLCMAQDNLGLTERELRNLADAERVSNLAVSQAAALDARYNRSRHRRRARLGFEPPRRAARLRSQAPVRGDGGVRAMRRRMAAIPLSRRPAEYSASSSRRRGRL